MTVGYEQYLKDLESYSESGGELYGFEGAFKDFNEVIDLVEERGTQVLSDIANDIGSVGGLSAGAAGIAQALGSVLSQSEDSRDLTDVISKITNSRKFEIPHGMSKVISNNYVGAAAISAYALNEFRENGDANAAAKTIVDSAIAAPVGVATGAIVLPLLTAIAGTVASPFALGAIAGLAAALAGAYVVRELNEQGFLDPLYDATENAIAELFGWQPAPPPHRDPLILDLDGNGVSLTESTYFDHNGNGIANRTQWVSSTDGFLVLDRDGNGTIDSGRELFGDNTLDANGNVASDGYAALKAFDSNGDDVINQKDQVFDQLKVWVDANSDGVSQENELKTLKSLGVKSIDLTHDNLHSQYHDASGKSHQTQSVNLDVNNFDRRFVESLAVPESFSSLPDMRGTGMVRDLHEAMTLSASLKTQVEQFTSSSTFDQRLALSEAILMSWAKTSQFYIPPAYVTPSPKMRKVYAIEAFYGTKVTPSIASALPTELVDSAYHSLTRMIYVELASQTHLKDYYEAITFHVQGGGVSLSLSGALDKFNSAPLSLELIADAMDFVSAMKSASINERVRLYSFISDALYKLPSNAIDLLQTAMVFNGITMTEVEEVKKVTFNGGIVTLTEGVSTTEITGGDSDDTVDGSYLNDVLRVGAGHDKVFAGTGDDTVDAGSGHDVVYGESGNDVLHGQSGDDQLFGGDGDDTLTVSSDGSNTLNGGAGNDVLTVEAPRYWGRFNEHASHANRMRNTLVGGTGNDRLVGGLGTERYVYNLGDGHDTIVDYDGYGDNADQIVLGEGIERADLSLRRDGNHMVLMIGGPDSDASITIENGYTQRRYHIEEVVLSDGTVLAPIDIPEQKEIDTGLLVHAMSSFNEGDSLVSTHSRVMVQEVMSPVLAAAHQD